MKKQIVIFLSGALISVFLAACGGRSASPGEVPQIRSISAGEIEDRCTECAYESAGQQIRSEIIALLRESGDFALLGSAAIFPPRGRETVLVGQVLEQDFDREFVDENQSVANDSATIKAVFRILDSDTYEELYSADIAKTATERVTSADKLSGPADAGPLYRECYRLIAEEFVQMAGLI